MTFDEARLRQIFERTQGRCHLCRRPLAFSNHGRSGHRGAWEVEHSIPRSRGGTNRLNNLYAAHITCNRSKGVRSTSAARRRHGYRAAPRSANTVRRDASLGGVVGALIGAALVPPHVRLLGLAAGAVLGYATGEQVEPE
ncbi:HNH endonuclease [Spiribacter halobius]|uniref:Endonuclease n=1 Tax=Sediminicurvatus halobius TaxID=2182432 RepID=A0A2U2MWG0_9GAMM|nr:endonuclease [Spiribacter halobius]